MHPGLTSGTSPLSFEWNLGKSDGPYQFLSRAAGYTIYLSGTEAALDLRDETNRSVGVIKAILS